MFSSRFKRRARTRGGFSPPPRSSSSAASEWQIIDQNTIANEALINDVKAADAAGRGSFFLTKVQAIVKRVLVIASGAH